MVGSVLRSHAHSLVNVLHSSSLYTRKGFLFGHILNNWASVEGQRCPSSPQIHLSQTCCTDECKIAGPPPVVTAFVLVGCKCPCRPPLTLTLAHTTPHCHSDSRAATGTHTGAAINNTHMYSAQRHGPCSCSVSLSSSPSPSPSPWDRTGCTEERSSIDCRGERGGGWVDTLTDTTHPPTAGEVGVSL